MFLSLLDGRLAIYFDAYRDRDLVGLGARLTYAWTRRPAFVDGLSIGTDTFDGTARVRVRGDRPLTLISADNAQDITIELAPRPSITVGRSPNSDVPLPHTIVSRRHSILSARADGWYLRDAESTSGTFLNDERISADTALHLGDLLRLGALTLLVT